MIINYRALAREKVERLKQGFTAFSETIQVTELIEKYIQEQNIEVHIDKTPFGCWFIPVNKQASSDVS